MKFLVVVLALAAVCRAEPEADPGYFYNDYYSHGLPYHTGLIPAALPAVPLPHLPYGHLYQPAPIAVAGSVAQAVVPQLRPYTPHDCVTKGGCAVRTLKDHGLVKRDADADAEAEAFYNYAYSPYQLPYGYNPYFHHGGPLPYAYDPYFTLLGGGRIVPQPVLPVVPEPATVEAPAPVVPLFPAPKIVKTAVVHENVKPVTYTHLGAHPISPTTVVEKERKVIEQHHLVY